MKKVMRLALECPDIRLADRYIEILRRISMKSRIRIPHEWKHFICRGCKRILIPGKTARFRTRRRASLTVITITCLRCGHIYRKVIKRKGK
ncbi:RNase P subunit [Candidatus Geothermarchaeota archaeon]|nr:MAG: RNase P subunit [Candidatus Geothermarchaeota archaeon]